MLAKQLRIRLESWYPSNYSEARSHDHELELYLWVDGRKAYQLFDYGPSDVVPLPGYFGPDGVNPYIYPEVVNPRFKVRLVAIERDGWPDTDDDAKGEITIDLDKDPPVSTWKIVAAGPQTDLDVEINFTIEYLTYVISADIPDPEPQGIVDTSNFPYPWGRDVKVFEHWLGLGRSSRIWADPARKYHEQVWFLVPLDGKGKRGKQVITTYRYGASAIGLDNDTMSSVYVPKGAQVVLYEHDFDDPRFKSGRSLRLGSFGLHNLSEINWDDRVSGIELITTQFISADYRPPN